MSECLLCQESFQEKLSLKELFTWKSWEPIIICPTCQEAFHYLKGLRCQQCSREWEEGDYCPDCLTW
ncbi:double zinc ribbon domain-containing protein [Aerococcus mictus]|uniref:Double zinc ribbon domain-containing protein n=2 Tax=Aerococcus mictus TaxID=2976810 RepID=A0A9Q4DE89_9LACT|nr:double zinc ribbon domain-containing protein [Aerococcus mictus]MCY3086672.1 double zinc ribbon domain-containing protein [Aerococcus mictus]